MAWLYLFLKFLFSLDLSESHLGAIVLRVKDQGLAVEDLCLIQIAEEKVGESLAADAVRVVFLYAVEVVEVLQGLLGHLALNAKLPHVEQGVDVLRIEGYGIAESIISVLVTAFLFVDYTQVVPDDVVERIYVQAFLV